MATILYGVGATKAGTSWLHRYLDDHPQTHFRAVKELHYWENAVPGQAAAFVEVLRRQEERLAKRLATAEAAGNATWAAKLRRKSDDTRALIALQSAPRTDHGAYLRFLRKGAGEARVVGDITPAYALLPEARLRAMMAAAPKARVVFLMREPVARLWSHVRMMAERRAQSSDEIPERAARILGRTLAGNEPEIATRGDYAGTLARLGAAIPADRLRVLFYEDLFRQDTIDGLCAFLGLDPHPADFSKEVLVSSAVPFPEGRRDEVRAWLAPQYDAARAAMGHLPAKWEAH
ncbi:MAG: sulfotransferase [Shimia sp.]